jgi:hypothetical protein
MSLIAKRCARHALKLSKTAVMRGRATASKLLRRGRRGFSSQQKALWEPGTGHIGMEKVGARVPPNIKRQNFIRDWDTGEHITNVFRYLKRYTYGQPFTMMCWVVGLGSSAGIVAAIQLDQGDDMVEEEFVLPDALAQLPRPDTVPLTVPISERLLTQDELDVLASDPETIKRYQNGQLYH